MAGDANTKRTVLADWDRDRNTGAICALSRAIEEMPRRDEFVDQLRSMCAQFEDEGIDVIYVPEVPNVPTLAA